MLSSSYKNINFISLIISHETASILIETQNDLCKSGDYQNIGHKILYQNLKCIIT